MQKSLLQCLTGFRKRTIPIYSADDAETRSGKRCCTVRDTHGADDTTLQRPQAAGCAQSLERTAGEANAPALADGRKVQEDDRTERRHTEKQASTSGRQEPCSRSLPEKGFYSSWRAGLVERTVLRLLSAARRKAGSHVDDPYETFPLQQLAFDWADAQPNPCNLRVFSAELGPDGKRCFIVTTYGKFWQRYRDMLPQHRHYYEIIRQGWPCHLYFDLEFPVAHNEDLDGNTMVQTVIQLSAQKLKAAFDLDLSEDWVLELDSSTPTKFSRHVIIAIPGAAFCSNAHVGAFVRDMVFAAPTPGVDCTDGSQQSSVGSSASQPWPQLLVNKDSEGGKTLFIDNGVYSRNRAFRLFLSSKAGKAAVLQPTGRYLGARLSHKDVFMASLICNVPTGACLLRCFDDSEGAAFSWGRFGTAAGGVAGPRSGSVPLEAQAHTGPSPHPDIEAFITSVCTQGGVQGRVRSWVGTPPETGLLLLNMRDNRWCDNVGRPHRSNGIFYVVDLHAGTWHQKCYDPDCRAWRSPIMPLPAEIVARLHAQKAVAAGPHAAAANAQLGVLGGLEGDAEWEQTYLASLDIDL